MPYPLPLTRTEAYLAYKAGVIQQSDLKPSLAVPRNGIDAWLAYWTGLAADYPKREDGTPHILQEEEAYIAYLCGVINEYPEKCLRRVGAYLRYLISARWGRPDHPLNREELYLSLIKTQFIPSGDPSSDIVINGTAKAAFVDAKMYGDTFQQSYTGKNLLNCIQYSSAQQGITCEVSNTNTLTVTGTSTTSFSNLTQRFDASITAGTFTLVLSKALSHRTTLRVYYEGGYSDVTISAGDTYKTFTMSADIIGMYVFMATEGTGRTFNETFTVQLVAGSTPDYDFERYTGAMASPNPSYPSGIQTVTGLQTVEIHGKNLNRFPYASGSPRTHRGVTFTANPDGSVTIKGTHDGSGTAIYYFRDFWDYNEDKGVIADANTTLTASITGGDGYGIRFIAEGYHSDETYDQFNTTSTQTITTTAKATFNGRITVYAGFSSIEGVTVYPMLEKGSTATTYEPYASNNYEINLGKNLFDPSLDPHVGSHESLVKNETGMTVTATFENHSTTFSEFLEYTYTLSPHSTYTLSKKHRVVGGGQYRKVGALRTHDVDTDTYSAVTDADKITFTTGSSGTIGILFYAAYQDPTQGNVSTTVEFYDVQIEAGENQSSFAKYFEPIELCKLGTYQDYIWKYGEDWKLHKATGKTTFTGEASEGWFRSGNTTETVFCAAKNINALTIPSALSVRQLSKMDRFTWHNTSPYGIGNFDVYNQSGNYANNILLSFDITKVADITAATTWISDNNPTLYYPIYTATDTTITNQALIDQLEALVKGGSEESTTYIKVSTPDPNLPGLLYVEAAKYV